MVPKKAIIDIGGLIPVCVCMVFFFFYFNGCPPAKKIADQKIMDLGVPPTTKIHQKPIFFHNTFLLKIPLSGTLPVAFIFNFS